MSKETRFCPFRRVLTRQRTRITENRAEETFKDRFGDCCGRVLIAHAGAHCAVATSLQYARENPEAVRVWMPIPKLPKEVEECLKYAP